MIIRVYITFEYLCLLFKLFYLDTIHIVNYTEKTQKNEDREYLDSKTGTYKLREYRPKSPDTPKLREYKPKFKEVKVREYVPKSHVTGNQYVTLREYDHTYEVEPPDDDDDRRMVCLVLMLSCGDPIKNLRGGDQFSVILCIIY